MSYINSTCIYCHRRFNSTFKKFVFQKPCDHICHASCRESIGKIEGNSPGPCAICGKQVDKIIHENDVVSGSQEALDTLSLRRNPYKPKFWDYIRLAIRLPFIIYHFMFLFKDYYLYGKITKQAMKICTANIHWVMNIHINLKGFEKVQTQLPKIFVCNHVCYLDTLILARFVDTGVLSSKGGMDNIFAPVLASALNTLIIDRGNVHNNTVTQMEKFVTEKKDSLFIFPQGIFGTYSTLSRFRTGAFATSHPVQPLVLRYRQDVSNLSFMSLISFPRVDVDLIALDLEKKTEKETVDQFCERVRRLMAEAGDMVLSRVDSHDVKER